MADEIAEQRNSETIAFANLADPPKIPAKGGRKAADERGRRIGGFPLPASECKDYKKSPLRRL